MVFAGWDEGGGEGGATAEPQNLTSVVSLVVGLCYYHLLANLHSNFHSCGPWNLRHQMSSKWTLDHKS